MADDAFQQDLEDFIKPADIAGIGDKKQDIPSGLWQKCPGCGATVHELELKQNLRVCPKCDHHFTLDSTERVEMLTDEGTFEAMDGHLQSVNALNFKDYQSKVVKYSKSTGLNDAVLTGRGLIDGIPAVLAVMDFRFLGASMGSVVGEKITRAIEVATAERKPVIIVSASGGARMHEGILSLMQMAKTSGALARHHDAGLAFLSILTHPTYGGVTASFATLGDINLSEPGSMVGFAGPRVVKETTHQNLPPGFQTAEFLLDHGLIDFIVHRKLMKTRVASLLKYMDREAIQGSQSSSAA
jgi:acetyl-CoA carboxylase carboxyl transferase subunit beta